MPDTLSVLGRLRRLIEEVDEVLSDWTDEELLQVIADARDTLELRKVGGMDGLVVQPDQTMAGYGITPDPTLEQGEMLALQAARDILEQEFRGRLLRGELGTSWQSGLEQESTISAAKMYADAITNIHDALEILVLLKQAPKSGKRQQ